MGVINELRILAVLENFLSLSKISQLFGVPIVVKTRRGQLSGVGGWLVNTSTQEQVVI
jgi:phosphoribosylaminoimidazole carboxylase (NCAIR synthetase)